MDFKLFFSTFALVFLAELGDKTQLASMAASAGTRSPWSVFGGAATALVLSTLIAVLVGSFLQRTVPQHYIKGAAALLFIGFGIVLLINAFGARKQALSQPGAPISAPRGILAGIAVRAALEFERGSAEDYERLAGQHEDAGFRQLFRHLADEEQSHLRRLGAIDTAKIPAEHYTHTRQIPASVPQIKEGADTESIIRSSIAHEKSTEEFYRALADTAHIPELKTAFLFLAAEEKSHAAHLEEFLATGHSDVNAIHQ